MTQLLIEDLDMECGDMASVSGGMNQAGNMAGNGPVTGLIGVGGDGGISLFSPTIAVNTVISVPVTVQMAMIQEQMQNLDISNILNSVLVGQ